MAFSFKNGPSLLALLEVAPLPSLAEFLTTIDDGRYAQALRARQWAAAPHTAEDPAVRAELIEIANALDADAAAPLDRHAQRILTLAEETKGHPLI